LFIALDKARTKEKHPKVSSETENWLRSPRPQENDSDRDPFPTLPLGAVLKKTTGRWVTTAFTIPFTIPPRSTQGLPKETVQAESPSAQGRASLTCFGGCVL